MASKVAYKVGRPRFLHPLPLAHFSQFFCDSAVGARPLFMADRPGESLESVGRASNGRQPRLMSCDECPRWTRSSPSLLFSSLLISSFRSPFPLFTDISLSVTRLQAPLVSSPVRLSGGSSIPFDRAPLSFLLARLILSPSPPSPPLVSSFFHSIATSIVSRGFLWSPRSVSGEFLRSVLL